MSWHTYCSCNVQISFRLNHNDSLAFHSVWPSMSTEQLTVAWVHAVNTVTGLWFALAPEVAILDWSLFLEVHRATSEYKRWH